MPTVSVCVPTFNHERSVARCIESVLSQSFTDFELIVVDDASTDRTVGLVRDLAAADPRIVIHENSENVGLAANHDRCIQLARGTFVKFVHADDRVLPQCLERMVAAFDDERVKLVYAPRYVESLDAVSAEWVEQFQTLPDPFAAPHPVRISGLTLLGAWLRRRAHHNWIGEPSAVMVRATSARAAGPWDVHLKQLVDLDFWFRTVRRGDLVRIPNTLSVRTHSSNTATQVNYASDAHWLDRPRLLQKISRSADVPRRLRVASFGLSAATLARLAGRLVAAGEWRRAVLALRIAVGSFRGSSVRSRSPQTR